MTELYSDADADPILAELKALREEVAQMRTARTLEHSSIGAGGLRVSDGGDIIIRGGNLKLIDEDGVSIADFGTLGDGRTGIRFGYDTGAPLFTRQGTPGQQFWGFWDPQGNIIVSNDAESGFGLARPYISMPLPVPVGALDWPSTQSASFTAIARSLGNAQQPGVSVDFRAFASAGTTGEVRFMVNGTQIGDTVTVSNGAFDGEQANGPIPEVDFGSTLTLELEARRTAGTGDVYGVCRTLYGTQS